ncbi:MAG: GNAT family N-acetyltransferase [Clostridia bacterium]|nr:GNAT family N-acetyltransferase [Clostridia bacterium]
MALIWKWAEKADLDVLVRTRVEVLRAANGLNGDDDLSRVEEQSRLYYQQAWNEHAALLVYDGEKIVGTGGVSFYQVMPTCCNPTGRKAYIMNMYTAPEYRRQGIAQKTLDMLVQECLRRGVNFITLEATAAGRPLYEKYGFVPMEDEMILPEVLNGHSGDDNRGL